MKTIKLTPAGLTTPEGEQRVAKALQRFEDSHATVANAATHFLTQYAHEIKRAMPDGAAVDDLNDVLDAIASRAEAQEEFMRAVANYPPRMS